MNLLQCLKLNEMEIPDYTLPSIIDVMRVVYGYCGIRYESNTTTDIIKQCIKGKKNIVFVLVDGMGSNLVDMLSIESVLRKHKKLDIKTVNPSTTGCAISSILTAEYPCKHGVIGWYSYYRTKNIEYYPVLFQDRKTNKDLNVLGIKEEDIYVYQSLLKKINRETYALFPNNIVDSKFSKFALDNNRIGYDSITDSFCKIENILNKSIDSTFTYLYISELDKKSHNYGVFSKEVSKIITQIENGIKKILSSAKKDLEIIIISDHGQIDVDEGIIMEFTKYNEFFYAMPGIDFGTATYYVKEKKLKEFETNFNKDFNNKMFLFKTEEYIQNSIFGNEELSTYMKSNLGEYISFCKKGKFFINSLDIKKYLGKIKGSHSGFGKEELTVPLIVI